MSTVLETIVEGVLEDLELRRISDAERGEKALGQTGAVV